MRIRRLNHSVYQVQYHIVWGTKYRRKFLKHYVRKELVKSFYSVLKLHPDWYMHKLNTGDDHVHLLLELPPKYTISEAVRQFKACSSYHLKNKFPFIAQIYDKRGSVWSTGYFVSTVGLNEENIRKYIEKQNRYDLGYDVSDEYSWVAEQKETPDDPLGESGEYVIFL